ncbi:MAG: rhodanese-like domain-containing protein [Chitinophagales bacterium]|nr:rhodanese-like domain-containing protein [Chitinophagales bacterium]
MINFIKNIFKDNSVNLKETLNNGAIIIDVRSKSEFASGHVPKSINIPLDQLQQNLKKLKKDAPIVVCCRSGNRSGMAKNILQKNGFTQVYNGGSWQNVKNNL